MAKDTYLNKKSETARRGVLLLLFFAVFCLGLCVVRIGYLTLVKGDVYKSKAEAQQLSVKTLNATRGTIYDSKMNVLAQSASVWLVYVNPSKINDGNRQAVIDGMASHHGDYEPKSMEAVLIAAADALSAARPGARRETLDVYVKRLEKLEEIANNTPGVEKSFAIQAGREIRIIAKPEEIKDDEMAYLAREISKQIESELEYPGQIKVNVIRETRAIDYAR